MAVCLNHYSVIWVNLLGKSLGNGGPKNNCFSNFPFFSDIKISRKGNRLVDSAIKLGQNDLLNNTHYKTNLIKGYCSSWSSRNHKCTLYIQRVLYCFRYDLRASPWKFIPTEQCCLCLVSHWLCTLEDPICKAYAISVYLQKLLSNLYLVI